MSLGQIPTVKLGGVDPDGSAVRLVAGLDPAGVGFQASVLLAFQAAPELRVWVVDLENRQGGGVGPAMDVIRRWHQKYDAAHWVVEHNLADGFITADKEVTAYKQQHGIRIEDFQTTRNKHDPRQGITALAPLFAAKQFVLPYAEDSKEKMDQLVRQLILWNGDDRRNRNTKAGTKTDLVMALWFCWSVIRRARMEWNAEMGVQVDGSYQGFDFNDAPWDTFLDAAPW